MLSSLELENYRGFGHYRLRRLSRVNLLVGKNNCGKTSLLEAVHLLAAAGDPSIIIETARRRGEFTFATERTETARTRSYPVISHFFHGHAFELETRFSIRSSDGLGEITVRIVSLADLEKQPQLFDDDQIDEDMRATLAVRFESHNQAVAQEVPLLPVTEEGLLPENRLLYHRLSRIGRRAATPVQFVSPDSLGPRSMGEMWDKVITEGRESEVIQTMRILEPDLEKIFFLSGATAYRFGGRAGVLLEFAGTKRRVPLGSHGDGMRRLLALSLALIQSQGGVLLIDEIDTGLHYSVMGDMWRLVIQAAEQSNVQVFATTHSFDCVKGLAWLCENYPSLGADISVQKIDCNLQEAVALNAEDIILAVQQDMEVR